MKAAIFVVLLAGGGYFAYKHFHKSDAERAAEASATFVESCRATSTAVARVDEYCACLAQKGVRSMMNLATDPASRVALTSCQAQVGHVAAPPPPPPPPAGAPPPGHHGRVGNSVVNDLQKAHERRLP